MRSFRLVGLALILTSFAALPATRAAIADDEPKKDDDLFGKVTPEKYEKQLRDDFPGKTVKLSTTITKGLLEIKTWKITNDKGKLVATAEAHFKRGVMTGDPIVVKNEEEK
jgi:hypothetical protein